jgi:glucosylceramidase
MAGGQDLRLHPQPPLHPDADATSHTRAPARLWVDTSRRFQRLEGFGGAFTEAAATTWLKLSPPRREAFMRACFDPQQGHGYTLCRVHMNSCDFALGNYAHVEQAGDLR